MRPLAVLCVLSALLLAGCSVKAKSSTKFTGAKNDVASAISNFSKAAKSSDSGKICDNLLSAALVKSYGGRKCSDLVGDALDEIDGADFTVNAITLRGRNAAVARVKTKGAGDQDTTGTLRLVRERGAWRISAFS